MDQALHNQIKARLAAAYGDRLQGVILYGSTARGEARPDSDLDLLVLLTGPVQLWPELRRCLHALYPLSLSCGRPLSPKPVDVRDFLAAGYPLYDNARREGLRL